MEHLIADYLIGESCGQLSLNVLFIIQENLSGTMAACRRSYKHAVRVLLDAKADPNITDEVKLHYCNSHCLFNSIML